MHRHRIRCEICDKTTTKGIIEKDLGGRDRYFCSDKCLNKQLERQGVKEIIKPLWLVWIDAFKWIKKWIK